MALILAKHLGARVIVTSGSEDKCQKALSMGADFAVNHRTTDWDQQVMKWCGSALPNLVVDGAGGETWAKCIGLVAPAGRIVTYGATAGLATLDLRRLFWRHIDVLGSTMGSERDFAEMVALFCAGSLRPLVDQVLPLAQASAAFDRMEHGQHMGKIVLAIDDAI
jgi:NADPH:quinone reductase-like Zn-dependent oxidoreductase